MKFETAGGVPMPRLWVPPLTTVLLALAPLPFLSARYRLLPTQIAVTLLVLAFVLVAGAVVARTQKTARLILGGSVLVSLCLDIYNVVALFNVILAAGSNLQGGPLLLSAMEAWLSNVAGFALVYWYINEVLRFDGGPTALIFPDADARDPRHNVLDYLFVAATTALAFGPTDTPPATTLARCAMLFESLISFLIVALVAARAINAIA